MAPRNNPGLKKDGGPDEPAATETDTMSPATAAAATAPTANAPAATAAAAELPAAKASRSRSKPGQSRSAQSRAKTDSRPDPPTPDPEIEQSIASDLNYSEARTALDLSLAQLQASDLDVESMAGLFRRAQSYAARCEALLLQVEQQVALWDSDNPEQAPQPYRPE